MGEEETEDQVGSPEREIEVTVQPRDTADLQIRDPGRRGKKVVRLVRDEKKKNKEMDGVMGRYRGSHCLRKPLFSWARQSSYLCSIG